MGEQSTFSTNPAAESWPTPPDGIWVKALQVCDTTLRVTFLLFLCDGGKVLALGAVPSEHDLGDTVRKWCGRRGSLTSEQYIPAVLKTRSAIALERLRQQGDS